MQDCECGLGNKKLLGQRGHLISGINLESSVLIQVAIFLDIPRVLAEFAGAE